MTHDCEGEGRITNLMVKLDVRQNEAIGTLAGMLASEDERNPDCLIATKCVRHVSMKRRAGD